MPAAEGKEENVEESGKEDGAEERRFAVQRILFDAAKIYSK